MTIKVTYNVTDVYMSQSVSPVYINVSYSDGSASGGGVWGTITGTLSDQTDLQNALNAKLDESTIDGGTEGQILSKASATDFDFAWINNYAKYLATNVRNQTGSTIAAFQVVYISGATGNKPLISLADADTEATSSKTYGVTATAIANNGTGDVVTAGELTGINTSAFNEGDLLWLSTTAGGVVTTPPAEPAHAVFIGYVVRSHPTLGVIDVAIANGYELNELHGVQITTPTDNQGLFYNSTSTLWENKSVATALGYTPANAATTLTINGVTYDLSTSRTWTVAAGISGSGAAGQVTYWTGASAVSGSNNLFWDNFEGRLGIGTNSPISPLHVVGSVIALRATLANGDGGVISNDATTTYFQALTSVNLVRDFNISGREVIFRSGSASYIERIRLTLLGNVHIGTYISDGGQKLQVYGDTLLRGSGNSNTTTALTVQDSGSTNTFKVRNDGGLVIGNSSLAQIFPTTDGTTINTGAQTISIVGGTGGYPSIFLGRAAAVTNTFAGTQELVRIIGNFTPASGSHNFEQLRLQSTINQTGGANGITRGLYVNPTLTSAADFRAIETTAGNVLFGSNFFWDNTNGRLGIGTNVPTYKFQVNTASGTFSSGVLVKNSGAGISDYASIDMGNDTASLISRIFYTGSNYTTAPLIGSSGFGHYTDGAGGITFWAANGNGVIKFATGSSLALGSQKMTVFSNGNVGIGSGNTDLGTRLGVVGDTLLRGSGATSATTALTVQNSSSTNLFTVRNDGNVGIGTASPTASLFIERNQNGVTGIVVSNNNAGTGANPYLQLISDTTAGQAQVFKYSSGRTPYKTIAASDFGHYNATAGDISFLNDFASGQIKLTAGGASSPHLTIKSNGRINMSSLPTSTTGLVAGDLWNDAGTVKIV